MRATPDARRTTWTRGAACVPVVALLLGLLGWAAPAGADGRGEGDVAGSSRAPAYCTGEAAEFVCGTYQGFVRRDPGPGEVAYWAPRMPADKGLFVATLGRSVETRTTSIDWYYSDFGKYSVPDAAIDYWLPVVQTHHGFRSLQVQLLAARSGDVERHVYRLYDLMLDREPSIVEQDFWVQRISETSRATAGAQLANSLEARRQMVTWAYDEELGRSAYPADLDYWAERLRTDLSFLELRIHLKALAYPYTSGYESDPCPHPGAT